MATVDDADLQTLVDSFDLRADFSMRESCEVATSNAASCGAGGVCVHIGYLCVLLLLTKCGLLCACIVRVV